MDHQMPQSLRQADPALDRRPVDIGQQAVGTLQALPGDDVGQWLIVPGTGCGLDLSKLLPRLRFQFTLAQDLMVAGEQRQGKPSPPGP